MSTEMSVPSAIFCRATSIRLVSSEILACASSTWDWLIFCRARNIPDRHGSTRSEEESLRVDPEYFGRGIELPPVILDPDDVYGEEALARDRPPDFDAVDPNAPVEEDVIPGGDLF